jgi:hypothetical protein
MHIVAFEEGFLENPARFVQRIAAIRTDSRDTAASSPTRYRL